MVHFMLLPFRSHIDLIFSGTCSALELILFNN
jgi:hypothetical protein